MKNDYDLAAVINVIPFGILLSVAEQMIEMGRRLERPYLNRVNLACSMQGWAAEKLPRPTIPAKPKLHPRDLHCTQEMIEALNNAKELNQGGP